MSRDEFDETFEQLRDASNRHAQIKRETDDYDTLNASRAELDQARTANTKARRKIVSRRDYATPDAVPAGRGLRALAGRNRWATGASAVVFLAIMVVLVALLLRVTRPDPLVVNGDIVERIGDDCRWHVTVPFINNGNEPIVVAEMSVIIEQRRIRVWLAAQPSPLNQGESTEISFERRVTPCPLTPEDVNHAELWATWRAADTRGLRSPGGSQSSVPGQIMRHRF